LYKPVLSIGNIWYIFLVTPISCPKILHEFQWNLALIIAQKKYCFPSLFSVCRSNTTVLYGDCKSDCSDNLNGSHTQRCFRHAISLGHSWLHE
jgi:hypothetical protein